MKKMIFVTLMHEQKKNNKNKNKLNMLLQSYKILLNL